LKRLIAAVLLVMATSAQATTFSTDASDLWWNASESGWGVNVIQQEDILFLTFFVYGPNGQAIWYSGSETRYTGTSSSGALVFMGPLHLTNGSWFGGPWNPSAVGYQQVGTVTFQLNTVNDARLTYTVGTATVVKDLTRLMWRVNDISGNYIGAAIGNSTGCAVNGYSEESFFVNVSQTPTTATIALINSSGTCTYTGPYSQAGRMGSITGTYSCSNGVSGTFLGYEIEANISGLSVRATTTNGGCTWQGRMGGIRRGPGP
jgi:hypothetical protein